jgi:hypothetical protein
MCAPILDPDRDDVFFYACPANDYEPVHRMTHHYDTYVLVDYSGELVGRTHLALWMSRIFGSKRGFKWIEFPRKVTPAELGCSQTHFAAEWLTRAERGAYERSLRDAGTEGDGLYALLERRVGDTVRRIKLIVLKAEAVATLYALFFSKGVAPSALCLLRPGPRPMSWTGFTRWNGPLARIMRTLVPPRNWPEIVLLDAGDRRFDWPYPHIWQGYEGWTVSRGWGRFNHVVARARGPIANLQAGQVVECPPDWYRRIRVHNQPLRPEKVGADTAVVLTPRVHRLAPWKKPIILLQDGHPPLHEGVVARLPARRPMGETLMALDRVCDEQGIRKVASIPFGFEDEALELRAWGRTQGSVQELDLHTRLPGDAYSLAGAITEHAA